jgi:hypothetical protein
VRIPAAVFVSSTRVRPWPVARTNVKAAHTTTKISRYISQFAG